MGLDDFVSNDAALETIHSEGPLGALSVHTQATLVFPMQYLCQESSRMNESNRHSDSRISLRNIL